MKKIITLLFCLAFFLTTFSQTGLDLNKVEKKEWLKDAGFGMFIHWSVDVQLGTVISHSLAGASEDYINKYINDLPQTFNPTDWDAERIVVLAKNAGMKYIVFTTKHHSGFCWWPTKTTDFGIANTPYQKDVVKEFVEACRKWDMKIGFYYSSEDFVYVYQQGIKDIRRRQHWEKAEAIQQQYKKYVLDQVNELLTNYGPIDLFFLDSEVLKEEVKAEVWKLQPDMLISRGVILTPEQFVPGQMIDEVWESNMTMGSQWQYKPTNDHYKSGTELINVLIEARAKGGSYLLNIGPDQYGELNEGQRGRLMEIAAWNFVNHEAIQNVRPWIISNESNIWFTKKKDENTVFAYLTGIPNWPRGERKQFLLRSIKATAATKISVLGQSGNLVEYQPENDGKAYFEQTAEGLSVSVVRAQRIYNNHRWPNPIVVKLENVAPALKPAVFLTDSAKPKAPIDLIFSLDLKDRGDGDVFRAGFEYRPLQSTLNEEFNADWTQTDIFTLSGTGIHQLEVQDKALESVKEIEYRAILYQDDLRVEGNLLTLRLGGKEYSTGLPKK